MDETTNGRQRPPGPEPTPEGRARLLTALDLERARHPVDPGQLGEYVEQLDRDGLAAARAAFPSVAAHLAAGCDACNAEMGELRAIAALDELEGDGPTSPPVPETPTIKRFAGARPGAPPAPASPVAATDSAQDDAVAAAALRRRQRRVLMTGLTAVAAVAMVVMGASLYALVALVPGGGPAEIKLIARETLTPASGATSPVLTSGTPAMAGPGVAAVTVTPGGSGATAAPGAPATAPSAATVPVAAPTPSTAPASAPPTAAPATAPTTAPAASPSQPGAAGQPKPGATGGPATVGSAAPAGNDCPDTHPVKANRESGIYHLRGGAFYDRTRPEVCYATAEDAERAGYRRSQR